MDIKECSDTVPSAMRIVQSNIPQSSPGQSVEHVTCDKGSVSSIYVTKYYKKQTLTQVQKWKLNEIHRNSHFLSPPPTLSLSPSSFPAPVLCSLVFCYAHISNYNILFCC